MSAQLNSVHVHHYESIIEALDSLCLWIALSKAGSSNTFSPLFGGRYRRRRKWALLGFSMPPFPSSVIEPEGQTFYFITLSWAEAPQRPHVAHANLLNRLHRRCCRIMAVFQHIQNRRGVPLAGLLLIPLLLAIVTFVVRGSLLLHTSESVVYVPRGRSRLPRRKGIELSAESWAGFAPPDVAAGAGEVESLLSQEERQQLRQLCGRCLYHQLNVSVSYGNSHKVGGAGRGADNATACCACSQPQQSVLLMPLLLLPLIAAGCCMQVFVATGDIPYMWIRDSAVQLGPLVARMARRPALRLLVEGAVRTQVRPWPALDAVH